MMLPLQPEARLNALLNVADIHLIPQRAEAEGFALPSKLAGILASGRPPDAQADGGEFAPDVLRAGAWGVLVRRGAGGRGRRAHSRLWLPSQNGRSPVVLQPHRYAVPSCSALKTTGESEVWVCEPS